MRCSEADAEWLVAQFRGYPLPVPTPPARPVPPLLYGLTRGSRDHTPERYTRVVLPSYQELDPAPRVGLVRFQARVHGYEKPEDDLPRGVLPAVLSIWDTAIQRGYYLGGA